MTTAPKKTKKTTLSAFDTGDILEATKIKQLHDERASAFQVKFTGANCPLRHTNGKLIGATENKAPIRILAYGGAIKGGDNKGFKGAAENVLADYISNKADNLCCYLVMLTGGSTQLVQYISNQAKNSIQSLDIFTHGTPNSLQLVMGSELENDKDATSVKRSMIYQTRSQRDENTTRFRDTRNPKDQYYLGDIPLDRFTDNCKIEIHGCSTAGESSNFAQSLSIALFEIGKKRSVVIAHPDKISGNRINLGWNADGTFTIPFVQYDYRHGTRVLYHNGNILHTFTKVGRLTPTDINQYLNKVSPV